MELPTWMDVSKKYDDGECLDPIENFIYCNEPGDMYGGEEFRHDLLKMLEFAMGSK